MDRKLCATGLSREKKEKKNKKKSPLYYFVWTQLFNPTSRIHKNYLRDGGITVKDADQFFLGSKTNSYSNSAGILTLPYDAITLILFDIPTVDLCRVASVNKLLNQLSNQNIVWKVILCIIKKLFFFAIFFR